jgi:hypothetical protein
MGNTKPQLKANLRTFIKDMLSEDGVPSSARVLSFVLSIWSMGVIAWAIHHMMNLDDGKLQTWVGGLPLIIGALTAFAAWPYAISKGGSSLSDIFKRGGSDAVAVPEIKSDVAKD